MNSSVRRATVDLETCAAGFTCCRRYLTPPAHSDVPQDKLGRRPDDSVRAGSPGSSGSSLMTFSAALAATQRRTCDSHTGGMLKLRFCCLLGHMEESSGQDVALETRRRILRAHRLGVEVIPARASSVIHTHPRTCAAHGER